MVPVTMPADGLRAPGVAAGLGVDLVAGLAAQHDAADAQEAADPAAAGQARCR